MKDFDLSSCATRLSILVDIHSLGDVTPDDSQRRFLAQHSVAMLEQCCNHSKQCCNNVATLCCAKNRRCESSRGTSPLSWTFLHGRERLVQEVNICLQGTIIVHNIIIITLIMIIIIIIITAGADLGGGCRGCAPHLLEMTCGFQ